MSSERWPWCVWSSFTARRYGMRRCGLLSQLVLWCSACVPCSRTSAIRSGRRRYRCGTTQPRSPPTRCGSASNWPSHIMIWGAARRRPFNTKSLAAGSAEPRAAGRLGLGARLHGPPRRRPDSSGPGCRDRPHGACLFSDRDGSRQAGALASGLEALSEAERTTYPRP